jgi:hypothetical protein
MSSVKRGLTGEKRASTDEFLIKKKDALIMPPDYKNLKREKYKNQYPFLLIVNLLNIFW